MAILLRELDCSLGFLGSPPILGTIGSLPLNKYLTCANVGTKNFVSQNFQKFLTTFIFTLGQR